MAIGKTQPVTAIQPINESILESSISSPLPKLDPSYDEGLNKYMDGSYKDPEHFFTLDSKQRKSLWSYLNPWHQDTLKPKHEAPEVKLVVEPSNQVIKQPINLLPELEAPQPTSTSLIESSPMLSSIEQKQKEYVPFSEIQEFMPQLSGQTIDAIILALIKNELILKTNEGQIESKGIKLEEKIKDLHQKKMDELKEIIAKDQKIINLSCKAQKIAGIAAAICSVFAICMAIGLTRNSGLIAALSSLGTPLSAGVSGLSKLTQTYGESHTEKMQSQFTLVNYDQEKTVQRMDERHERIDSLSNSHQSLWEKAFRLLRNNHRMNQKMIR